MEQGNSTYAQDHHQELGLLVSVVLGRVELAEETWGGVRSMHGVWFGEAVAGVGRMMQWASTQPRLFLVV